MAESRSPQATVAEVEAAATAKSALPTTKLFVMSALGGMFIAIGALLSIVVAGGSLGLQESNPGLVRLVMGAVFPVGFIAVVLTGAGLFTSDCATQVVPWYRRRVTAAQVGRLLVVAYAGNVVGAVGLAVLASWAGILAADQTWTPYLQNLAAGKVAHGWAEVVVKGVLANMLVCVAAWQAYTARSTEGKMVAIWFPVMAFVALGTEHSIANLFFIPAAMLSGADIGVAEFLTANLVPATLGNWIGGALLIGLPYAWLYAQARVDEPALR